MPERPADKDRAKPGRRASRRTTARGPSKRRIAYLEALCRSVPYHIVERVLEDPTEHSVTGEVFDGSVMYADVVGFTGLCERLAAQGPEGLGRLSRILSDIFAHLLDDAIFPYGGYVVQFGGDSLTVFFRGEDQTRRAVAAALTCQRTMHGELGRLLDGQSGELMLRIGLAAGEVRVPVLGDYTRRVALCTGSTAQRAMALQRVAQPNEIVAGIEVVRAVGNDIEVVDRHEDRAVVRGLRQWPKSVAIEPLGARVLTRVDEKISMLEPLVAEALSGRMKSTPSGWRIEGELRSVVALFAEVTELAEATKSDRTGDAREETPPTGPLDVARLLLRTYRKFGGIVAKVDLTERGQRLMVLFGLHMPASNDAERALLAGLEANARVKGYAAANGLDLTVSTGVHAGRVYFGAIGSDLKHDITVVGDTVNLAATVAAAAEPFELLVTTPVLKAVGNEFEHSERGPARQKGAADSVTMHVIHATAAGRAHFVQARQESRYCAGRRDELETIGSAVDAALAGTGQIIGISGPAGAGKSFILAPVIDRWIRGGGVGVLGRCRFATRSTPLAPVVAMFHNFLGLTDRDTDEERRDRIRTGLEEFHLRRGAPELMSLLQPVERTDGISEALVDLAEVHARERVLASIIEFLGKRVSREPMLYLLEDVQYADTLTLQLAQRMTTIKRDHRFLMIATFRPDPVLKDLRRGLDDELRLNNLALAEASDLIAHEIDARSVDPDLAVFLWRRTEGRPGHLVEILRFLAERQLLHTRAGVVEAPEPGIRLLEDIVPRTLAQVALARIDDLGAMERRMLRMASAIGRRFGRELLEALAVDAEPDWVEDAMTTLTSRRVIVASSHERQGYMFRDGVTRAVTYGTIPASERRQIHKRIADALEELPKGDARRSPAILALHRERAEEYVAAARWYRRAVRLAVRAGLDREACDLVDRWEQVTEQLSSDDAPNAQRRARMAVLKLVATARQGSPGKTVRAGRAIAGELWSNLEPESRAVVDYWLGDALARFGRPAKARARLERVFLSEAGGHHRADAARLIAETYAYGHDLDEAKAWLDRAAPLAVGDPYRELHVELVRANVMADAGNIDRARSIYSDIRGKSQQGELMPLAAKATTNVAYCDMLNGHFDLAVTGFEEAIRLDRGLRDWAGEANDQLNLGQTYTWAERPERARKHLTKALGIARELGEELTIGEVYVHLGAAIAVTEDPFEGAKVCRRGLERVIKSGLREAELAADLHLCRLALLRRDLDEAEHFLNACREHGKSLANLPLFRRVFADLERQVGEGRGAQEQ